MSEKTLQLVAALRARIEATRRRLTLMDVAAGLLLTTAVAAGTWFVSVALEAGFWLSTTLRWIVLILVVLAVLAVLTVYVVVPLARLYGWFWRFTDHHVARLVGRAYPEVSDRMVNFLQLVQGAHSAASTEMLDRAVSELGRSIEPVPFEKVATSVRIRRAARYLVIPLTAVLVFVGASPDVFTDASRRILSPGTTFSKPAPFSFSVEPGNREVVRGDSVEVSAAISDSQLRPDVTLEYGFEGEIRSRKELLQNDVADRYAHLFAGVNQSLRYRFSAASVSTDWYRIDVIDRPIIQRLDITLHAPAYARLPVQELDTNVGDITALAGTRAELALRTTGSDVASARLIFGDDSSTELSIDGGRLSGSFTVQRSSTYRVLLENNRDVSNSDPITYEITVIDDESPTIAFLYPQSEFELSDDSLVPFAVRFSDDYGFSRLRLHHRLAEARFGDPENAFSAVTLPLDEPHLLDQVFEHVWSLKEESGYEPAPGDVFEYYVEVFDNDSVHGKKSAQTPTQTVRFPSLTEQYENLDRSQDDTRDALENLLDEAEGIRDQFQNLKQELRQNPDSDWQDERRLEQLQQRQQELESSVEDVSQSIQEMTDDMQRNDLVSEETLDLFQELREVVDEVNSPELMEALRNLQDALQKMDPNQMQQSLDDFDFNEDQYMNRLDRALELFKNLRVQQDLEEAQRRADDLAKTEDTLQEESARLENEQNRQEQDPSPSAGQKGEDENKSAGEPPRTPSEDAERLASEQEQAASEMEALEKKLEEVRERMEEMNSAPVERMQDLEEDTKDREIPDEMRKAAEDARSERFDQAGERQQQTRESLQQLSGQLGQMQQNMQGQQLQMNMAGLRASLADVLTLSERQEALRLDVTSIRSESPRLRTAAQDQVALSEGLGTVADSLQRLARKIPQMSRDVQQQSGEAVREMASAVDALTERSARNASGHQKGAMTHLNELALILSDLLDQMMNGSASSGGGMSMEQLMEQLQNMGQQQQDINDQIQQLLNDAQGNRMTVDMLERMRQMGAQQEQIRNQLKQINRDRSARNKLLGDLNRLADQMEESVRELMQNRLSRELVERQRQILTRLLEASRSLQERGKEQKRESRSATETLRESPPELTPSEKVEHLRRELFRALESGYAPDYEQLIRRYFELLQQQSESTEQSGPDRQAPGGASSGR